MKAILFAVTCLLLIGLNPSMNTAQAAAGKERTRAKKERPAGEARPAREDGHWLDPVKDEPPGTKYKTFFSKTINGEVSYLLYLPPDYETAAARRYPVIYWLHGGGGSQRTGDYFIAKLDAAIRAGVAPAAIAILVNGVGSSLFSDSFDGKKPVETVIVRELIPHVDQAYRTLGTRAGRAVEGFSMGGFGALHLGFKYPGLFGSVTALAHAPIRPDSGWRRVDTVWQNGPFAGNAEFFKGQDPFALVEKNAAALREGTRVRLIVGDADNSNTVARTKELQEKMKGLGLACDLTLVPGVAHSYTNLYDKIGDPVFKYYAELWEGKKAGKMPALRGKKAGKMPALLKGLYVGVKPPESEDEAAEFLKALQNNPCLAGVLIGAKWNEIEPKEGRYDFAALDRCAALVRQAGKQYKLKVMAGINSPEYIYHAGAARFETIIANPNRGSYGDPATIPIPWDPVYQRHFSRLIKTFGERYAADPLCVAVTLTCANYMSAEMHLPRRPEDMARWAAAGLTSDKLFQVYCQYMDEWAGAFPRQLVCLHMSKTANLEDASPNPFIERIVRYGLGKHPGRFALQNNGLNGRKETADDPEHPLFKFRDKLNNGYQSLASFKTPERQGTIEMAALNFVRMDSEYWELWQGDGMNPETCRKVQAAVDEAQRLGYTKYKQKLTETGRYRRAEDDRWAETMGKMRKAKDAAREKKGKRR